MSQESEPCIQDYARYYGLTQDHRVCGPLECISPPEDHTYQSALEDPPHGIEDYRNGWGHSPPSYLINARGESHIGSEHSQNTSCVGETTNVTKTGPFSERMFIDSATASLLGCIFQPSRKSSWFDEDVDVDAKRFRRLKHAPPLLRSDHECDLEEFRRHFELDLQNEFLPFETLDEEADEGLTWPSKYLELPDELWKKLTTEKLTFTVDVLKYLSEIVNLAVGDIGKAFLDLDARMDLSCKKRYLPERATPPLLPMSPDTLPFLPSSETGHLDLLSESSSPTKKELRKIELQVFARDAIKLITNAPEPSPQSSDPMLLDVDSIGDIYSPLKGSKDPPSSPPDERLHAQPLKVEDPLFPSEPTAHPPWIRKSVSFNDTLTEIIPNLPMPLPDFYGDAMLDDLDAFFDETIKPIAIEAERAIEQEQLQEADTTRRVAVPIMDFSLPVAPWETALQRSQSGASGICTERLLEEMKAIRLKDYAWHLSGKIERELRWTPFPAASGVVELQETIRDDGKLTSLLMQPACVDTNTLTWKPEGLRMFDELRNSSGEELEEGSFDERKDFESLIRKRKLLMQNGEVSSPTRLSCVKPGETLRFPRNDILSALGSLEGYMYTRAGTVRAQERSANQSPTRHAKTQEQVVDKEQHQLQNKLAVESHNFRSPVPPSPYTVIPRDRRIFIISATFLKDRKLARQIQKIFPTAELVERRFPFHTYIAKTALPPNIGQSKAWLDSLECEADVIISPSTGLLWTTLQTVKQRSLPGQAAESVIRERVRHTAPRYQRLIVLISEGRQASECDQSHPRCVLDSSDCEAIAQFTAFCSNLEDNTQAIFIIGGFEELARWIVAMMIKHSISDPAVRILQDETPWEVFLKRAGMNVFAAQTILGKLNRKDMEKSGRGDFGLTVFVKMSERDRFAKFEGILGGRGLLSRINNLIESRW